MVLENKHFEVRVLKTPSELEKAANLVVRNVKETTPPETWNRLSAEGIKRGLTFASQHARGRVFGLYRKGRDELVGVGAVGPLTELEEQENAEEHAQTISGHAGKPVDPKSVAWLTALAVEKAYRCLGGGTLLMQARMTFAKQAGYRHATFKTLNPAREQMGAKEGWRKIGVARIVGLPAGLWHTQIH